MTITLPLTDRQRQLIQRATPEPGRMPALPVEALGCDVVALLDRGLIYPTYEDVHDPACPRIYRLTPEGEALR